jgi:hypothetical protein
MKSVKRGHNPIEELRKALIECIENTTTIMLGLGCE